MSVDIKFRELRNYTQEYVVEKIGMSPSGYGKIEQDETEITLKRIEQIAEVLKTDIATVLNFDSNQIFNQYNNKTATANGVVQNQQIIADQSLENFFRNMSDEIKKLQLEINTLKKQKN